MKEIGILNPRMKGSDMAYTPEGKVKAAVDRILKRVGAYYVKPVSNGMGRHGIPDYIVCFQGRFLGIECKGTDAQRPTPLQQIQMGLIHAAGGATYVATPGTLVGLEQWLLKAGGVDETVL